MKLQILSERIVRAGTLLDPEHGDKHDCGDERLVVRWKTEPRTDSRPFHDSHAKSKSKSKTNINDKNGGNFTSSTTPTQQSQGKNQGLQSQSQNQSHLSTSETGTNRGLSKLLGGEEPIFKLSQEQQFSGLFIFSFDDEGRILTHTIEHADEADGEDRTAKFVTLTDWLIGKARGSLVDPSPNPGLCMEAWDGFGLSGRGRDCRGRP